MPSDFVELIELALVGDGWWSANIPDGWDFMGVPNGGLVSSVMATALVNAVERPDPITSTAHFLRPAVPGPVVIETEIIRTGRSPHHGASGTEAERQARGPHGRVAR